MKSNSIAVHRNILTCSIYLSSRAPQVDKLNSTVKYRSCPQARQGPTVGMWARAKLKQGALQTSKSPLTCGRLGRKRNHSFHTFPFARLHPCAQVPLRLKPKRECSEHPILLVLPSLSYFGDEPFMIRSPSREIVNRECDLNHGYGTRNVERGDFICLLDHDSQQVVTMASTHLKLDR